LTFAPQNADNYPVQRRLNHPVSPAVMLTVAMVLAMGAAAQASAGPVVVCPRHTWAQGNEGVGDSVSRWLSTFSSSIRKFNSHGVAMVAPPRPSLAFQLDPIGPALEPADRAAEPRRQVQAHLIDLPPPAL